MRNCPNLPPCLAEPVPAGFRKDVLMPKAGPVSGGNASVITQLRKRGKLINDCTVVIAA